MSHVGSSLRRLRLESGVSLRDLARRLGVSSAYLSRVENGLDASPTPERLEAIARELGLPAAMLLEAGHRTSPLVTRYVEHQPQAAALFLAIARAQLEPEELYEVQRFVERRFKRHAQSRDSSTHRLAPLLAANTVVLGMRCDDLEDAYEIGCVRLAEVLRGPSASQLITAVRMRAQVIDPVLGDGVAVVSIALPGARPHAALIVLATPQPTDVGDGVPIQVVLLLIASAAGSDALLRVAHVARLASRGLAMELAHATDAQEAIDKVGALELVD